MSNDQQQTSPDKVRIEEEEIKRVEEDYCMVAPPSVYRTIKKGDLPKAKARDSKKKKK